MKTVARCCDAGLPLAALGRLGVLDYAGGTVVHVNAGAAALIAKRGAGVLLSRASDVVPVVRRMVEDSAHYSALRAATIGLAFPNATRQIVEEITALIPATDKTEPAVLAEVASA